MRGVRAPRYTQELLQSCVLSRGTSVSCSVSELCAAGDMSRAQRPMQQRGRGRQTPQGGTQVGIGHSTLGRGRGEFRETWRGSPRDTRGHWGPLSQPKGGAMCPPLLPRSHFPFSSELTHCGLGRCGPSQKPSTGSPQESLAPRLADTRRPRCLQTGTKRHLEEVPTRSCLPSPHICVYASGSGFPSNPDSCPPPSNIPYS